MVVSRATGWRHGRKLLDQVVKKAWTGPQASADGMGGICALELLVRFRQRCSMVGGGAMNPSLRLQMAKQSANYGDLAKQFGVPPQLLEHAFSDGYMDAMKIWRVAHGLSIEPVDW